jgi:transcriptional regulator with XRE-family HTH domain
MTAKEMASLAARVKKLREAAKLSQQDLAVKAGLSTSMISQIEQGKKEDPRRSTLEGLATALGMGIDELLGNPRSKKGKK